MLWDMVIDEDKTAKKLRKPWREVINNIKRHKVKKNLAAVASQKLGKMEPSAPPMETGISALSAKNLKRLLTWCRGNRYPADLSGVFQIETWKKMGTVLWKAISHRERYILGLVTIWKLINTTMKQLKPEKTVTSISDSKLELWDSVEQKLWDKVSNGHTEAKSLVTTWKLERSAAAGIFAALQPDKYPESCGEIHPVCVCDTLPMQSPAVLSAPPMVQQLAAGGGTMPNG